MQQFGEWTAGLMEMRHVWGRAFDMALVVIAVLVVNLVLRLGLRYLARRVEQSPRVWDDALYHSLAAPLRVVVWIVGLVMLAEIGGWIALPRVGPWLLLLYVLAWVAVTTWFLIRLIGQMEKNLLARGIQRGAPLDATTTDAISKLLRGVVLVCAGLVALQSAGVSVAGLLAFGGVGGIAIGFAAKDIIANFLGGLTIYLNRPFSVGDWIRSPDRDIEGVVEAVGWRATTVRRFDMRPLYVPNAIFTTVALENPSRMTHRLIYETIPLRFDDVAVIEPIVTAIQTMLDGDDEIDASQGTVVYFNRFSNSSLDLVLWCYTLTTVWARYQATKQRLLVRCCAIIAEHGAEVAFPTSTLRVPSAVPIHQVVRMQETNHRGGNP